MKKIIGACILSIATAFACSTTHGTLELSEMTFRALNGAKNGSAYLTITETSETGDKLIGAACAFADHVEIHDHITDPLTKAKKMVEIGTLEIPGTKSECSFLTCWFKAEKHSVSLKKGGKHLMLMELKPNAIDQKTMDIELTFEKAGKVTVTFKPEDKIESGECCHGHGGGCAEKHDDAKH